MSVFLTELVTRRPPGTDDRKAVLVQPFVFKSDTAGVITVPAGFVTDYASVPRLPFAYLLFGGVADEAAVIHDFLYSSGTVSRKIADAVFREAMQACDVAGWRRWPMWLGVRMFGGSHYSPSQQAKAA
jgi:hypothetical protein